MNKVEEILKTKAVLRKGLMLFKQENVEEFIKLCEIEKIVILGIDGFLIGENWIQPNMEHSIDFSSLPSTLNRYEMALSFIRSIDNDFFFEIVCDD